ncbi:class I SAM-dependent methyltransferase [Brachybacterium saurashtrense]|uniref:Class I SAM-dependent methyltransferase n=1 Tax=Brachybacterium saurashtrense TaxID=556288 RepID=A0A345YLQ2_9MICO|nr:class I SAM-dependent methyltransferase [Brachybacterium saurashtrense]AXK44854.1 class I SAM-dependent methyltransferase [Brachybacterium saurashtrense]RRR20737.1 class I SAM-dependent methyltransferase [Brachybacterium saurashtrense]
MYRMFVRPEGPAGHAGAELMARTGVAMADEAVATLDPASDGQVLEIGFGPGLALQRLAAVVSAGHVTGVDPSTVMHRHARERNRAAIEAGRMTLVHGTAAQLPVRAESVDAVLAIDNLHFWPDISHGLGEVVRVLRPGGRFVCAFTPPSGGPPHRLGRMAGEAGLIVVSEKHAYSGYLLTATAPSPRLAG